MKILFFITSLRTGGAERLSVDLLRQMKAAGHEVGVLLMDGTRTPLLEEAQAAGIPVHSLSQGWRAMRNPLLFFPLLRFLKKGKYDIVHAHNSSCQLLAAAASLLLPVKMVTTEHVSLKRRSSKLWLWYRPADRLIFSRYGAIICVGESVRRSLEKAFPKLNPKIWLVPNGIDTARLRHAVPAADIAALEGPKVLMVAAFRPQKDHKTLLRAAALLPANYDILLAGGAETDADRRYMEECRALAGENQGGARLSFLGIRTDIPALMAASDIIVLSSHYEGASLAAIEAMASGKPFISSEVRGLRSMVSGAGELFPEGDSQRLAALIEELASDPERAAEVAAACMKRAEAYDISRTAKAYLDIYETII